MIPDLTRIRSAIEKMADADTSIAAVFLHGSASVGRMDEESDVDIAILAGASVTKTDRRALRLRCIRALGTAYPDVEEKFDVVILQDVPVLLRYNVIRKGTRIVEHDRAARIDFELATERAYDDEEPYLRRETEMILQNILSRPA